MSDMDPAPEGRVCVAGERPDGLTEESELDSASGSCCEAVDLLIRSSTIIAQNQQGEVRRNSCFPFSLSVVDCPFTSLLFPVC